MVRSEVVAFVAISMGYLHHLRNKVLFDRKSTFQEKAHHHVGALRSTMHPTEGARTDVWPFRQIFSSIENMQLAPVSGTTGIQARRMLRVKNASLVPVSASLFMDIAKAFGLSWLHQTDRLSH
jgi:hypothetical protein